METGTCKTRKRRRLRSCQQQCLSCVTSTTAIGRTRRRARRGSSLFKCVHFMQTGMASMPTMRWRTPAAPSKGTHLCHSSSASASPPHIRMTGQSSGRTRGFESPAPHSYMRALHEASVGELVRVAEMMEESVKETERRDFIRRRVVLQVAEIKFRVGVIKREVRGPQA